MNGEIIYMNTSKESSEINKCNYGPVNMVNLPLKALSLKLMFSSQILSSAHSGYKLFAFSVLGLRGILTACTNFLLKCKLLTSQSFHLFYLLM